ncbi:MAG: hypothetical protein L3K06_07665 [Thermoplasmata archaeon]|nr:hypothetical protein [Thermoplasmata archaeon]
METVVQLSAQIETAKQNALVMALTGRAPENEMKLVFHFRELERVGMVQLDDGRPKLKGPGDRLAAIRKYRTLELIETMPENPGWYATEVQSIGFGLGFGSSHRNLLLITFKQRDRSEVGR